MQKRASRRAVGAITVVPEAVSPVAGFPKLKPTLSKDSSTMRLLITLFAALTLVTPLLAQESTDVARERTFYVPFDELDKVFEKEGRGIFLPYDEFLRLWEAAELSDSSAAVNVPLRATVSGGVYNGEVVGAQARFTVAFEVHAVAKGWSTVELPLSGVAIEQATLSDPQALFTTHDNGYAVHVPKPGRYTLTIQFATSVTSEPGKRSFRFGIPPVAVSKLELTIPEADVRVEVEPMLAATQRFQEEGTTRVLAFLGNSRQLAVSWSPPPGRASTDGAVFEASQRSVAQVGERILQVESHFHFIVHRGEVDTFRIQLPAGLRLLSVKGENIRQWSPENNLLTVNLHAAVKDQYSLRLSFEQLFESTPSSLDVRFPQARDTLRETGWVVLGHDGGLRSRVTGATNLSQLDPTEVPENLRSFLGTGYRYLAQPVSLAVDLETITPVVEGVTTSVVSIGEQEDLWVGWIDYSIQKAGLFEFAFSIPTDWNVVEVGDPSFVEEFRTAEADGRRTVTVGLKARALGALRLPFRFAREGTAGPGAVSVEPPRLIGVERDRGLFGVSVPRSIEAVTTSRENAVDVENEALVQSGVLAQLPSGGSLPRSFRYRSQPASVTMTLTHRKTEIDVLAQHLVEVSEAELRFTHLLDYSILYAPTDVVHFTAPTSLDDSIRVESEHKTDVRRLSEEAGRTLWAVNLQPPVLGPISLAIRHATTLPDVAFGTPQASGVPFVHAARVRTEQGFVAIRKEGSWEITPNSQDLESIDASNLPDKLRRERVYGAYRYLARKPTLDLALTRYDTEQLSNVVIPLLFLESMVGRDHLLKTKATIFLRNTGSQSIDIRLPADTQLLSLAVAGQDQSPRSKADGTLVVDIPTSAGAAGTFAVELVSEKRLGDSALGAMGSLKFETLEVLDVPVAKTEMHLYLPPDFVYYDWEGSLRRRPTHGAGYWMRYKSIVGATNETDPVGDTSVITPRTNGVGFDLQTRGYRLDRLESLAARGDVRVSFASANVFWAIDCLAFLLAVAVLIVLLRMPGLPHVRTMVTAIAIALVFVWFSQEAGSEIATSVLWGFLVASVVVLASDAKQAIVSYRKRRLNLAPDPFLEEAGRDDKDDRDDADAASKQPKGPIGEEESKS